MFVYIIVYMFVYMFVYRGTGLIQSGLLSAVALGAMVLPGKNIPVNSFGSFFFNS